MKKIRKKISKNKKYFTLAVIVLALFTGIVIQSCQTDDSYNNESEKKASLKNFETILIETVKTNDFKELTIKRNKLVQSKSRSSKKELNDFETNAKSNLAPLLKSSIIFLHSKGITDNQLINEYGSLDSPKIILCSTVLFSIDNDKQKSNDISLNSLFKIQTANAENFLHISDHAFSCLESAVGVTAIVALYRNTASLAGFTVAAGATMTTAETMALVGLIAERYAGWFGVGCVIYSFSECYYGW